MNSKYYPMNCAEVLDFVLEIYKKSFAKQVAVSVIFTVIFFILVYVLLILGVLTAAAVFAGAAFDGGFGLGFGGGVAIAIFLLFLILGFAVYGALTSTGSALITKHTFLGEHCDVGGVVKDSFKKIWIATAAALANLIVLIPAFFILGLIIYLYIIILGGFFEFTLTLWPIIIITLLLVLLMLAFFLACGTVTLMSMKVAIFEGRWFFGAVKRSFTLVKPDFLKLMGLLAVWSVVTMAATYSLESLFSIGALLSGHFLPGEAAGIVLMSTLGFGSLFSLALGVLLAPLSGIFSTMVYMNQRIKLEGLDIELSLSALEVKRTDDDDNYIRTSNADGAP